MQRPLHDGRPPVRAGGCGEDAGFRSFDLAIPLGISYEYANFVIDARYNLGLIGILKGSENTMRNSVFQFSLGYKIPFSN